MMTLTDMVNTLRMMGFDANSGEFTIILKDKNKKIDLIEIHRQHESTRVVLIRDGITKIWDYGNTEMREYNVFSTVMDIAGGIV